MKRILNKENFCALISLFLLITIATGIFASSTVKAEAEDSVDECGVPEPKSFAEKKAMGLALYGACMAAALPTDVGHIVNALGSENDTWEKKATGAGSEVALNPELFGGAKSAAMHLKDMLVKAPVSTPVTASIKNLEASVFERAKSTIMAFVKDTGAKFSNAAMDVAAKIVAGALVLQCNDVVQQLLEKKLNHKQRVVRITQAIDSQGNYMKGLFRHQWIVASQALEFSLCAAKLKKPNFEKIMEYGEVCEWGRSKEVCEKWKADGFKAEEEEEGEGQSSQHAE